MLRHNIGSVLLTVLLFTGCEKISETSSESELNYITYGENDAFSDLSEASAEDDFFQPEEEIMTKFSYVTESTAATEPPSTEWDPDFYGDCLFFGDSICRALSVYSDLVDPERVAAVGGGAARNLSECTFMLHDTEYTVASAAEAYQPDMAFLWMGINDINMTDKETYAANLEELSREINEASPESKIIIIGMTPTAAYHEWGANPTIIEYNRAAEEMTLSSELPLYYIDVGDVVSDSEGYLLEECDGGDGMHLTQTAYYRILSKINTEFADLVNR